jgi:hypothetical protein
VSGSIAQLFLNPGTRRGCVPRPLLPPENTGTHCTGGWVGPGAGLAGCRKSRPTGIKCPDCPARSESLYRLSYPGSPTEMVLAKNYTNHSSSNTYQNLCTLYILEYTQNDLDKHLDDANRLEIPKQELIPIKRMQKEYIYIYIYIYIYTHTYIYEYSAMLVMTSGHDFSSLYVH